MSTAHEREALARHYESLAATFAKGATERKRVEDRMYNSEMAEHYRLKAAAVRRGEVMS